MAFLDRDDYDRPRDYLAEEGMVKMKPVDLRKAEEADNEDMIDSNAQEIRPGDIDPGLESLGFGQGRLASEPPALLQEGPGEPSTALLQVDSGETSRTATPGLHDDPGLSHSPGSSTMDDIVLEDPQVSMAYNDQADALLGSCGSEHTSKQAERRASEERPVTPDAPDVSARSRSSIKSIASPYAGHGMNTQARSSAFSPVIVGYSPSSPSNVIVRMPVEASAQHRVPRTPEGQRQFSKGRDPRRRVDLGLKKFKCPFQGCDKEPFKTKFELKSHQNVHKSTNDFPCGKPGCKKRFRRLSDKVRHEERSVQHGGKGIACPYCSETEQKLARIDNLKKHIIRQHGNDRLEEYKRMVKTSPRPPQQTDFEFIAFRPKT